MAIAGAAFNPPILLADEPTGNLDSQTGSAIPTFSPVNRRDGCTIVMLTHIEKRGYSDRRIYLRDGRV